MPTFTPPTVNDVPAVYTGDDEQDPWRFFADGPRGVNVWKLNDGTYTQVEPQNNANVVILYHGGHVHPISAAEATLLIAAGYGANVT